MSKTPTEYKEKYPDFSYKVLELKLKKQFSDEIISFGYSAFLGGDAGSAEFYMVNSLLAPAIKSAAYNENNKKYLKTLPFQSQYKLQIHIALSEKQDDLKNYNERARAWDIIKDVLISHQVREFKVVAAGLAMSDVSYQTGKDVTINVFADPREIKEWNKILNEINQNLKENKAPLPLQGAQSSSIRGKEYPIRGTTFMTYRYDFAPPQDDLVARFISISPPVSKNISITDIGSSQASSSSSSSSSRSLSSFEFDSPGATYLTPFTHESKIESSQSLVKHTKKTVHFHYTQPINEERNTSTKHLDSRDINIQSSRFLPLSTATSLHQEARPETLPSTTTTLRINFFSNPPMTSSSVPGRTVTQDITTRSTHILLTDNKQQLPSTLRTVPVRIKRKQNTMKQKEDDSAENKSCCAVM